jgi:N-methyl-L-tryptophan oxidase
MRDGLYGAQPVRKVFSWFQSDGRYSAQNKFPAFTGELPNGEEREGFWAVLRAGAKRLALLRWGDDLPAVVFSNLESEKDALKIGKHNGGQVISSPEERKPFGACPQDGSEAPLGNSPVNAGNLFCAL